MSKHKKQHFIPRSYLASWCDPETPKVQNPYVWVFSKDGKSVKNKSPKNIFTENEMYTIVTDEGERNLILEYGLQSLENMFCKTKNKILSKELKIDIETKVILCAFAAAMHSRTKSRRDFEKTQWQRVLDVGKKVKEAYGKASPDQKEAMSNMTIVDKDSPSLSFEEVERLAHDPIKETLMTNIQTLTQMLCKIDMVILTTTQNPGFITSDSPCVWTDPEAYKRPPYYRSPALMYESIEILLPISPNQTLFLNRKGINGYFNAPSPEEINRIIRFNCDQYFIVNTNYKNDYWFFKGEEPEDSWEKMQGKTRT